MVSTLSSCHHRSIFGIWGCESGHSRNHECQAHFSDGLCKHASNVEHCQLIVSIHGRRRRRCRCQTQSISPTSYTGGSCASSTASCRLQDCGPRERAGAEQRPTSGKQREIPQKALEASRLIRRSHSIKSYNRSIPPLKVDTHSRPAKG